MSTSDLLSSTLNWPGKGFYGLKSSVLQTTENNLVKQGIVVDHMKNHYRRLNGAKSAVDSKPPKAMISGQKSRDRVRKEMAQLAYTQNILDQFQGGSVRSTPRGRSVQSARSQRFARSQPTTARARSRSTESARMITRSLTMNGSMQNLNQKTSNDTGIANKLFGDGVLTQALTSMAALGKMTSTSRNKSSADVLDKHPDSFSQPDPHVHQPRLVKRDGDSFLRNNRTYYNPPPRRTKSNTINETKQTPVTQKTTIDENKQKDDEQSALREQLNRSFEVQQNVEKKIKKAKRLTDTPLKKQSDQALKQFGLTERERLQYVRFMQEVTDAVIRNNLTTEPAIEKLYEIHIDRNRGTLDERRLRALLEALKQDLGVQSSRKTDTYASVHKATSYDNDPLPPQTPVTTREDSLILTPKTPHYNRKDSPYDINDPLPWQAENNLDKQSTIRTTTTTTTKTKANTFNINNESPLDDDHLFSPSSSTPIKPKPRLSLQTKTVDPYESVDSPNRLSPERHSPVSNNLTTTMRQPKQTLSDLNWLQDDPTTLKSTKKRDSLVDDNDDNKRSTPFNHRDSNTHTKNHFDEHNDHDNERRNSSPKLSNHRNSNGYSKHTLDDNDEDRQGTLSPQITHHRDSNGYTKHTFNGNDDHDDKRGNLSPQISNPRDSNTYGSNDDFEDPANQTDNSDD